MAFVEAALISIPAVIVAPWLAARIAHPQLGRPLADIGLHLDPKVTASAYALAAAAGAVCIAGLTLPALRARGVVIARDRRRVDVAGACAADAARPDPGRARVDRLLAAPALPRRAGRQPRRARDRPVPRRGARRAAFAGALLSLRLVPLVAWLVERVIGPDPRRRRRAGLPPDRPRPRGYSRSILLLVLAVAIGVFAATYSETWHHSQVDQAALRRRRGLLVDPRASGAEHHRRSTSARATAQLGATTPCPP